MRGVSPDPDVAPAIQANYLSSDEDCLATIAGVRLIRDIMRHPPPACATVAEEMLPGPSCVEDETILAYARAHGGSLYHPTCTAAIGRVVDTALRGRGIDRLRVTDGSAMPSLVSGNTNAAIIAMAERGADLILGAA